MSALILLIKLQVSVLFILFLHYAVDFAASIPPTMDQIKFSMKYLKKYGYIDTSNPSKNLNTFGAVLRTFQKFNSLDETGMLDDATLDFMNKPRCGNPDIIHEGPASRQKRNALLPSAGPKRNFTYRISKYSSYFRNNFRVNQNIAKAFKVWSDVTNVDFIQSDQMEVDIDIQFVKGEHGDNASFKTGGKVIDVAHFLIFEGRKLIHFNDVMKWTLDSKYGIDIFRTAVHEIGHLLGLNHSNLIESIMFESYVRNDPNMILHPADISNVQKLYDVRETIPKKTSRYLEEAPDLCEDASVDAAMATKDGKLYVFKCNFYWEITPEGIVDGFPDKISEVWPQLPGYLDAAYVGSSGNFFFFKDHQYWSFSNKLLRMNFPKNISLAYGNAIPKNVDAIVKDRNGFRYAFKGGEYWQWSPRDKKPYVSSITDWKGLNGEIDAAIQWHDGNIYFFKGQYYYKWSKELIAVGDKSVTGPHLTAIKFFGCSL